MHSFCESCNIWIHLDKHAFGCMQLHCLAAYCHKFQEGKTEDQSFYMPAGNGGSLDITYAILLYCERNTNTAKSRVSVTHQTPLEQFWGLRAQYKYSAGEGM